MTQVWRESYDKLIALEKSAAVLGSCSAVLGWDKETNMPRGAREHRSEQLSMLAGLLHERQIAPEIGELLSECEAGGVGEDPESIEAANVREIRRGYDKLTKLPTRLVEELARETSLAHGVWIDARAKSDYAMFEPSLARVVALTREKAEAYDLGGTLYDALLDDYEPRASAAEIATVFEELRGPLVNLVARIGESPLRHSDAVLRRNYPVDRQKVFVEMAAAAIGFDFGSGRIDEVAHPFCTDLGRGDVRLTTRYSADFFNEGFFGVLHEAGHGLYEQGFLPEHYGTPMSQAVSLAIHESQSRLWENFVGRSREFWQFFFPHAKAIFREALDGVDLENFYAAMNVVQPSFIRVEADEVTYNLHIILRFELEQKLISGELSTLDLPEAWNALFQSMFGMKVERDSDGCLQDTHWGIGAIGYFPTYCLGNCYAAQFCDQARRNIPDLDGQIERGEFSPLLNWLRGRIHNHGMRWRAGDLVKRVTGRPLDSKPLIDHLEGKFGNLYRLR